MGLNYNVLSNILLYADDATEVTGYFLIHIGASLCVQYIYIYASVSTFVHFYIVQIQTCKVKRHSVSNVQLPLRYEKNK